MAEVTEKDILELEKEPEVVEEVKELNAKQELFCTVYASVEEFFGNGVKSYIKAYGLDPKSKKDYENAKANAHKLLTNAHILRRINELLDITLNDAVVDKELAYVVIQKVDLGAKMRGISEYNKLKKRIENKLKVEHEGEISLNKVLNELEDQHGIPRTEKESIPVDEHSEQTAADSAADPEQRPESLPLQQDKQG